MYVMIQSKEDITDILSKDMPANNLARSIISKIKFDPLTENVQSTSECTFDEQMEAILLIENWCALHNIDYVNVGYLENGLEIIGLHTT